MQLFRSLGIYPKRTLRRSRPGPRQPVPPIPAKFNFGLTARRPLVPLAAASLFLNLNHREVIDLIEAGKLRWAFDIRSCDATRREIRILRRSLFEFSGLNSRAEPPRAEEVEFQRVMDLILPQEVIQSPTSLRWRKADWSSRSVRNFQHEMRLKPLRYEKLTFPEEPVLRGSEIAEYFSCLRQHVVNLIGEKMFQLVDLPIGPKASPFVTRASVIKFLKERRMS
ncbi:MAG: hypothetical protein JWQ04_347 [Pedosphaera sp.]|nr:hypothetical protein [Pedosphaera sp.]